jgi:hypothetical protein
MIFFSPFWVPCNNKHAVKTEPKDSTYLVHDTIRPEITGVIDFTSQVQPILVIRCSPCHFPGGKMYSRMPFDQDTTILSHEAGILRRIKDEKENAMIKAFAVQRNKGK